MSKEWIDGQNELDASRRHFITAAIVLQCEGGHSKGFLQGGRRQFMCTCCSRSQNVNCCNCTILSNPGHFLSCCRKQEIIFSCKVYPGDDFYLTSYLSLFTLITVSFLSGDNEITTVLRKFFFLVTIVRSCLVFELVNANYRLATVLWWNSYGTTQIGSFFNSFYPDLICI